MYAQVHVYAIGRTMTFCFSKHGEVTKAKWAKLDADEKFLHVQYMHFLFLHLPKIFTFYKTVLKKIFIMLSCL